ncbi:hypothetical protein D6D02_05334 [Aureobasidium pullulans]|nr:hypothetical protein D6D18_05379 [Aureobasidium pullulans]THY12151.1 hypothetical protein D6D02_05334 [Aureobasidium pullulans]THZ15587.1 hypothetical protein D6C89_09655 [Aureobasidium pullulans]
MINSTAGSQMEASSEFVATKSQVYEQYITITDRYGQDSRFPLWYVDTLIKDAVVHGIIPAVQFGACLILFLVLMLLSKHDKRRSPVFLFNTAALFFNIILAILQCCVVTSSFWDIYPVLVGDYGVATPAAYRLTAAVSVFLTLVSICIEVSLVLQVHVVSVTLKTWQKMSILAISAFVAVIAMGFRIAQSAISVKCIFHPDEFCSSTTWLAKAKDITLTISICFFSAIFCAKLGWSLRERRKLGMKQFGSMQIIFIGGFQTMIIPAIFSLIQFINAENIPNIGSNILTATCISLPLTSLWASSHAASPSKAARGHDFHRKFLVDSSTADSTLRKPSDTPQWSPSQLTSKSTPRDRLGVLNSVDSRSDASSWGKLSPGPRQTVSVRDVDRDLEMQQLKERD